MGSKLKQLFEDVGKEKGPVGRMQLAMLTKITTMDAPNLEDSPENLKLVTDAIKQLFGNP